MNKEIFLVVLFIVFLFSMVASVSSKDLYEYYKPIYLKEIKDSLGDIYLKYDSRIIDGFKNSSSVEVEITIKDNSGIIINSEDEDVDEKFSQQSEWLKNKSREMVNNFPRGEFNLSIMYARGTFKGNISENLFYELLNNSDVALVLYKTGVNAKAIPSLSESVPMIGVRNNVWDLGYTGEGVKVCVIDTGADKNHTDLYGKVIDEKCYCSDNGGCCTNNQDESDDATDEAGHGTHVSGIIASQNSIYKGVAYDVDLYIVKVFGSLGEGGDFNDIASAVYWCDEVKGVDIITMSLGDGNSYTSENCTTNNYVLDIMLENARDSGIFIDVASGNDGYLFGINYPACNENVFSVGSVYDNGIGQKSNSIADGYCTDESTVADLIVCSSDRGYNLGVFAPGCAIKSTAYDSGNDHITYCGTSMAAPHVAGVAALLLERDPTLTPDNITTILRETGVDVFDLETQRVYPRVNASAAINSLCTCTNWTAGSCGGGSCNAINRLYTRTCTPSGCDAQGESKCQFDSSCLGPSGEEITVCASGCDYTTINSALSNSDDVDRITISDNRTYNEQVYIDANTTGRIECPYGAKIYGSGTGIGIEIVNKSGFLIENCTINNFGYGMFLINSRHGDLINLVINNSQVDGLVLQDDSYDVRMSELQVIGTEGDNAIWYDGYEWSASVVSFNNLDDSVVRKSGHAQLIWVNYGLGNKFRRNNLSEGYSGESGLEINGHNNNCASYIEDNRIFSNGGTGFFLNNADYNQVNRNLFCPSNGGNDFYVSGLSNGNVGENNRCDNPDGWDDSGYDGCTYSCDLAPEVDLLFSPDNYENPEEDVSFFCRVEDNLQVKNVSLYTNITGSWLLNQTKEITGTSNITHFDIYAENGTTILWNCLGYDNASHSSWGNANRTLKVILPSDEPPAIALISPENGSINEGGSVTFSCSAIDDFNLANMTLYGNWNGGWHANETKSLTGTSDSETFTKVLPEGIYQWNCLSYDNASQSSFAVSNWTINVTIPEAPANDTYKFYHKNSANENVAWFGSEGNIVLKGQCYSGGSCNSYGDNAIVFGNSTDNSVAYIDSNGNLCLEYGDCSDESLNCNSPTGNSFIVKDSSNVNMIYIDGRGELCLTGQLYPNSNP